jgi:hypothetical protein
VGAVRGAAPTSIRVTFGAAGTTSESLIDGIGRNVDVLPRFDRHANDSR